MTELVLGVDPGKMTGAALYSLRSRKFTQQWQSDVPTFVDWAWALIPSLPTGNLLVACERFDITVTTARLGRSAENWSIEVAGVLRHLCRRHGQHFILQSRASRNRIASNAHLREAGWYATGRAHANDATRHVVLALAEQFKIPPPWVS